MGLHSSGGHVEVITLRHCDMRGLYYRIATLRVIWRTDAPLSVYSEEYFGHSFRGSASVGRPYIGKSCCVGTDIQIAIEWTVLWCSQIVGGCRVQTIGCSVPQYNPLVKYGGVIQRWFQEKRSCICGLICGNIGEDIW